MPVISIVAGAAGIYAAIILIVVLGWSSPLPLLALVVGFAAAWAASDL